MRFRPYPVMTVLALAALIALGWLGSWQWSRYIGKLNRVDIPIQTSETVQLTALDIEGAEAQSLYAVIDGEPVWRRYVPAIIDGDEGRIVLTPWDAISGAGPVSLPLSGLGSVERDGRVFVRPAVRHSVFGPANEPAKNIWYQYDGTAMMANMGLSRMEGVAVAEPVDLTIRDGADLSQIRLTANPFASPALSDPLPPARHLGYALTWWGLALSLIVFYVSYHVAQGRLRLRGKA